MGNVSVEKDAINKAIALCNKSIQQYRQASKALDMKYQEAGHSWHDGKYQQLGGVVRECTTALNNPVKELEECVKKLTEMLIAIEKYESENI